MGGKKNTESLFDPRQRLIHLYLKFMFKKKKKSCLIKLWNKILEMFLLSIYLFKQGK